MRWRVGSRVYREGAFQWLPVDGYLPLETPAGGAEIATGLASETDSALSLARVKLETTGRADETDTAFARTLSRLKAAGLASETDAALSGALSKRLAVGVAVETDAALAPDFGAGAQTIPTGRADEVDTGLAASIQKRVALGVGSEGDASLSGALAKRASVGSASGTDIAISGGVQKVIAIALSIETDAAFARPFEAPGLVVGLVDETDEALAPGLTAASPAYVLRGGFPIPARRRRRLVSVDVGAASEIDGATALRWERSVQVRSAVERAVAGTPTVERWMRIASAFEVNEVANPALHKSVWPGLASDRSAPAAPSFGPDPISREDEELLWLVGVLS